MMLEAAFSGLGLLFQWPAMGFLGLGICLGIWLGVVPGLGGLLGLVMLLPFTFGMEAVSAFALLLGVYATTATSDTVSSVMLGVPGSAASQATVLDGYALAKKGEAQRAFGAAFTVSAFGGIFGATLLALSLPLILPVILAFGRPEIFMLGVLALSLVGSLSGNSVSKGLVAALVGLFLSTIGFAETSAMPRFTFGIPYLSDGLLLIPAMLGLFAIPEIMELATRGTSISRIPKSQVSNVSIYDGMRDVFKNRWLAVRCATIGTYIGILPGIGGSIVDWVAYGHAVQTAKDKSKFGLGDIRGVIAPESANNAIRGGELLPTVAFGIPGSIGAAVLMGALLIQGLRPGPEMLTTKLDVTFSMIWSIVIANIAAALFMLVWSRQVARIAFINGHFVVPAVILFVFMGAWMGGSSYGDWIVCLTMGIVGYIMKKAGWSRPPLVLGLILGDILENAYVISLQAYPNFIWLQRPIVLVIISLIGLAVAFGIRNVRRSGEQNTEVSQGEGREKNLLLSLPMSIFVCGLFTVATVASWSMPLRVMQFPATVTVLGISLSLLVIIFDSSAFKSAYSDADTGASFIDESLKKADFYASLKFLGLLFLMVIATLIVGQVVAICSFIILYLRYWGGIGWKFVALYSATSAFVLYVLYDQILRIFWHRSMLDDFYHLLSPIQILNDFIN